MSVLESIHRTKKRLEEANVSKPYSALLTKSSAEELRQELDERSANSEWLHVRSRQQEFDPPRTSWMPSDATYWGTVDGVDIFVSEWDPNSVPEINAF